MGEVYLARDMRLDRKVALKVLSEKYTDNSEWLRRFVREAKAASALNHPNILTIHEVGEVDGIHPRVVMVMIGTLAIGTASLALAAQMIWSKPS